MRIAYICLDPGVPVFGCKGCSVHVQEVVRSLRQFGHDVELFATRMGGDRPSDLVDLPFHVLPVSKQTNLERREGELIRLNETVSQCLQAQPPFDLIYERFSLFSHAAMESAVRNSIPGILEVNSPLISEQKTHRRLVNENTAVAARSRCLRAATSIIAVSSEVAEGIGDSPSIRSKTTVVPNGVNVVKFASRPRTATIDRNKPITIGFVGTLKPWHGVSNLIKSFDILRSRYSNVQLSIVGDGPLREQLDGQIARCRRSTRNSILWHGAVAPSDMPSVLHRFDVAVAPYPQLGDFYFSPLKILEYMAAGLPVVASRIGQIPSIVEHGRQGLLCTPGSVDELTNALELLALDSSLRICFGKSGQTKAASRFCWNSAVQRILKTTQSCSASPTCVGA